MEVHIRLFIKVGSQLKYTGLLITATLSSCDHTISVWYALFYFMFKFFLVIILIINNNNNKSNT